jgi:subtilisin family serine protease
MKPIHKIILLLTTVYFIVSQSVAQPNRPAQNLPYQEIPNEYILVFNDSVIGNTADPLKNVNKGQYAMNANTKRLAVLMVNGLFPELRITANDLKSIDDNQIVTRLDSAAAEAAKKSPKFKYVIKNYSIQVFDSRSQVAPTNAEQVDWGVQSVSNAAKSNLNLPNKVWLLDSGVDPTVEDLNVDRELSHSFIPGVDYSSVAGVDDHGTHVAGIIGAKRNNRGIVGIAPNVKIVALKIIHNGRIPDYSYYLNALKTVLEKGAKNDVMNLSIQNTPGVQYEQQLIRDIGRKGLKVAIAAGNSAQDIPTYLKYPALISGENIFTVGSYDDQSRFSVFSNYGSPIVYCAPGNHILSTLPNNTYGYRDGTSQATPHVTGLLILQGALRSSGTVACPTNHMNYQKAHE